MRATKALAALVAAAMLASTAGVAAFAEEKDEGAAKKTYNYVALGDSIAAGYGLNKAGGLQNDPALIITDQLLENPVQGAYPAIFTSYLKELGLEKGCEVQGTNLASTAFRAQDIEKVIKQEGYKGEFAAYILDTFLAPGTSDVLIPYHDYYNKYLSEADLVSIQLGGNDIVMSILPEMQSHENPVIRAVGMSLTLTLFGADTELCMGAGLQILSENKDSITTETFLEAANYMKNVGERADELVTESANNVKGVVEAVQEVNGETDIALLGMFNPYRTESESKEVEQDIFSVVGPLFTEASNTAAENEDQVDAEGQPTEEYIETVNEKVEQAEELKDAMDQFSNNAKLDYIMGQLEQYDTNEELAHLISVMKDTQALPDEAALREAFAKFGSIEDLKGILNILGSGENISELPDFAAALEEMRNSAAYAAAKRMAQQVAGPIAMQMAGKNVDPQIKSLNEKLEVIAEETGATFVDVYGISPETDFDPHPDANGHKEIADIMFSKLADMAGERMGDDEVVTDEEDITTDDDEITTSDETPTDAEETTTEEDDRVLGDVNGDGIVNVTDVVITAAHVKSIRAIKDEDQKYADIDGNDEINVTDLVAIAAHVKSIRPLPQ